MRHKEIPELDRVIYQKTCDVCDHVINISSQRDNGPEYYTCVYVQCECGNWMEFILPVN